MTWLNILISSEALNKQGGIVIKLIQLIEESFYLDARLNCRQFGVRQQSNLGVIIHEKRKMFNHAQNSTTVMEFLDMKESPNTVTLIINHFYVGRM